MAELPDEAYERIQSLCKKGDALAKKSGPSLTGTITRAVFKQTSLAANASWDVLKRPVPGVADGKELRRFSRLSYGLTLAPDGKTLLTAESAGQLLLDATTGKEQPMAKITS